MSAQGVALGGPAGARVATAPRLPTLLSLPDAALAKLFAQLSARPGVALGPGARDPHALAAAHPRLDRLFRCELVTRLEMSRWVWERNSGHKHFPSSEVQRALQRHPRATTLLVDGGRALASTYVGVDIAACAAAARLKVIELTDVQLGTRGASSRCGVAALLARCRGLEEFRLVMSRPKLHDSDLCAMVSAAGPRLRVLSLHASAYYVTDAGGPRLRDLTALTDLDLMLFRSVGEATFAAIAALPVLASLSLAATRFSDEHAASTLPLMRALRELDVSSCSGVGPGLWAALPPTLRVLCADHTALLVEAPGDACSAALVELHASNGSERGTWDALAGPHVRALRALDLVKTEALDDAGVDAALKAMPRLEELDLRLCRNVGDRTAAAVARHAALRVVDMRGTNVGPEGVRALRRWEADGHAAALREERTTAGRFLHVRTVRLDGGDSQ